MKPKKDRCDSVNKTYGDRCTRVAGHPFWHQNGDFFWANKAEAKEEAIA